MAVGAELIRLEVEGEGNEHLIAIGSGATRRRYRRRRPALRYRLLPSCGGGESSGRGMLHPGIRGCARCGGSGITLISKRWRYWRVGERRGWQ